MLTEELCTAWVMCGRWVLAWGPSAASSHLLSAPGLVQCLIRACMLLLDACVKVGKTSSGFHTLMLAGM